MNKNGQIMDFAVHKTPIFTEINNIEWVIFGHETTDDRRWNNRYPDYLIHLYNSSPKHNAIVNEKCIHTIGQGLDYVNPNSSVMQGINAKSFLGKIKDGKVFEFSVKDRALHGGFTNEMIYNRAGDKVVPHHIDWSHIRRKKPTWNEKTKSFDEPLFFFTSDWSVQKPENNKDWVVFHQFNFEKNPDKTKRYLFVFLDYRPNLGAYALPEYLPCVPYISADFEVSNFVYNNIRNGFSSGYLINFFNGEPTDDDKAQIEAQFDGVLHGTDEAGKSIKSFNEDKESGVEITPIAPNGQDDRFINLNKSIRDEIYTGHGVDPVIVGLKGDAGFNNNADEKRTAIEGWQNGYVDTQQDKFEMYFTAVLNFNGTPGDIVVLRKPPIVKQFTEAILQQILSIDELRELAGHTKLEPEEKKEIIDTQMSSEDTNLLQAFEECGQLDINYRTITHRQVPIFGAEDAETKGKEFIEEFATRKEINVLTMIISGVDAASIQSSLDISESDYNDIIISLTEEGLLNEDGEPTDAGVNEAEQEEIFVVYKYVKRSDVTGPAVIDTTRDFCKGLIAQSKFRSWTIDDINALNNGMGLDVFTSRGGWTTIEGTDTHVPFCRHIWEQRLVKLK